MCRCLAGQHVHRGFRVVGEQDIFEGACPKDCIGLTRSRETGRRLRSSNHQPTAGLTHSGPPENSSCHEAGEKQEKLEEHDLKLLEKREGVSQNVESQEWLLPEKST